MSKTLRLGYQRRLWPGLSVEVVLMLIEIGIWRVPGRFTSTYELIAYPVTGLLVAVVLLRIGIGFRPTTSSLSEAWNGVIAATGVLVIGLVLLGEIVLIDGEWFRPYWEFQSPVWFAEKLAVVSFQQVMLHYFLFPAIHKTLRNSAATRLIVAVIFGLLHLPSLIVVMVTTISGWVWVGLFRKSGRIIPLICSHFVLAMLAYAALPVRLNANMGVGANAMETLLQYEEAATGAEGRLLERLCSDDYLGMFDGNKQRFLSSAAQDLFELELTDEDLAVWEDLYGAYAPRGLGVVLLTNPDLEKTHNGMKEDWADAALKRMQERIDQSEAWSNAR